MIRLTPITFFTLLSLSLCCWSCATIFNSPLQNIKITRDKKIRQISIDSHQPHGRHLQPDTGVKTVLRRFAPIPKGTTRISLAVSPINFFNLKPYNTSYNSTGFTIVGIGTGIDYFYKPDRYLSLSIGVGDDQGIVDHIGVFFNIANTAYASVRDNYTVGRFDLGYGISFSALKWRLLNAGKTDTLLKSWDCTGLGLSLSARYRIGQHFGITMLYQPTLVNTNVSPALNYQHYFSLNLDWRFSLSGKH